MERNEKSGETCLMYLGKKKKPRRKAEECKKLNPSNKSLSILDTSAELSSENLISLEEKPESNNKNKIIGFDDLTIPPFFNDKKKDENFNKILTNYKKMKAELGSNELAKLYLIDFDRLYEKKKNYY